RAVKLIFPRAACCKMRATGGRCDMILLMWRSQPGTIGTDPYSHLATFTDLAYQLRQICTAAAALPNQADPLHHSRCAVALDDGARNNQIPWPGRARCRDSTRSRVSEVVS